MEEPKNWTVEEKLKYYHFFENNIEEFAKYFFPHLVYKKIPDFHHEIYRELPKHPYLAIEMFRGGGKSTIGLIIYPIHFALFKKTGDISLISKSESFIINEISRIIKKELEQNERIKYFWGDLKTPKWSETYFVLRNGIAFEGGGIGGQLRGGRRGLIALDDLEDEESASSEEQRDKLKRRINKELIPKLLPEAQMVYFGTFVHNLCYLKQLFDIPDNGWTKKLYLPYEDGIQKEGRETWSEMFPHYRLQQIKKTMGSNYFACEFMGNPVEDENVPIREGMLRYYKDLPSQYSCVIAVDPAYSEDTSADYKVAVVIAIDQNQNRYLVDYIRTHSPSGEYTDSILNLYLRYRNVLTGVGIPHGAGDKEFYSSFIKKMEERKCYGVPLVELKNVYTTATGEAKRGKKFRITAALQPWFENGKYYIAPHHVEAREELLTIGQSRWDDLVDAMAYAEQIIQPVYFDTGEKKETHKQVEVDDNYGMG